MNGKRSKMTLERACDRELKERMKQSTGNNWKRGKHRETRKERGKCRERGPNKHRARDATAGATYCRVK
jgi:hypothetical protein